MEQPSEFLTVAEVAAVLKISREQAIRKFENMPGVLDLGSSESRFKRRYRVLRIPRESLQRFIMQARVA